MLKTLHLLARLFLLFSLPVLLAMSQLSRNDSMVTVIYSGNLDGELEPCGCSDEGNLGGIKRRTTILDGIKENNPQAVVVSAGGLIASQGTNDYLKSQYIFKAFSHLPYDAIGVQWADLSYGASFAAQYKLPWVASNWIADEFDRSQTIRRDINGRQISIRFFTWLDPGGSPLRQMPGGKPVVDDDAGKLAKELAAARKQGVLTMLATALPLEIIKDQFNLDNIDILFVRAGYEVYAEPQKVGNTLVLAAGSRGMRLGQLQLSLDGQNRISHWQHEVIAMPESVPDSPRMQAWYQDYNAEVKREYLERVAIRKQQESGESPFAGEEQCKQCHAKQYKVWQDSEHAIAFEDLEAVQKSFDPECIQCHTVGFNKPGGFVDISITPHLMNVQCENCHGAAKQHVVSAGRTAVANKDWPREKMCAQCHVQKHSPAFQIDKYWPKIAH